MNAAEAYDHTREVIEDLRATGITVEIAPSKARDKKELVEKYSGPERVAPEKWVNVSFTATTPDQSAAIAKAAKELGWLGINFDTGGMMRHRDWELDWSFSYTARPDGDREMARDAVEDMISKKIEGQ